MLPGSVPPSLTFSSELDFVPMPTAVTPVFFPSELPSQSLPPVHSGFSSRELASRSPSPVPQALFFGDDANDAEYTSQPGCIDPSLLAIAPSAPTTNANFASSPDVVNPSDTANSPATASLPGTHRPETADEGSNVGDLHGFVFLI